MNTGFYILITLTTFIIMEGVTWCTHKFIMHGFLWNLHENQLQESFLEQAENRKFSNFLKTVPIKCE